MGNSPNKEYKIKKRKKVKLEIENTKPGLTYAKAIGRDKKTKTISMATVPIIAYLLIV